MEEEQTLVVYGGGRVMRRYTVVVIPVIVTLLTVSVLWGHWLNVVALGAGLLAHLALFLLAFNRAIIDAEGITLDERWRRRQVPWAEVDVIRLRWRRRDPTFAIVRRDGAEVAAEVLGNLARADRREEQQHLVSRLRAKAAEHDFELDLHVPGSQQE